MPKAKPDQVIVHRIELQDTERDLLASISAGIAFNQVADPIVKLLNDVTGTITFLTLLAATGLVAGISFTFLYDPEAIMSPIEQFLDQARAIREQAEQNAADLGRAVERGPLWGTIDILEQVFGINLPDFGGGYEVPGPPPVSDSFRNPEWSDPTDFWSGTMTPDYTSTEDVWRQAYSSWGSSR